MIYRFSDCSIDPVRHVFSREGQIIHLEPQVFDVLLLLAQNAGALVSRDQLIEDVWNGLIVSDSTISARISAARTAVGDSGRDQRIIKTISRRGFQLVVPVETTKDEPQAEDPPSSKLRQDIRFAHSADGLRIAYATSGSGPPLLRAGHWLSHLELDWQSPVWRPLLDALGSNHRLYRYDQRGTGLSGRVFTGESIDEFVDDLKAVADANGLERFPIFAASQAAPVAIKFAALHPERVSKLILLGGYAEGRVFRPASATDVDENTVLALIRNGWGKYGSAFVKAFSALFMPDATQEQIDSFVEIQLESASPEAAVVLRKLVDRFSVTEFLPKVRAPTLVIHANADVIHPIEQGRLLASEIPDARFVMLDSGNHVPLPQHPSWNTMISEIDTFLGTAVE
jgi:pimeloyl-ACP methyl ester carboxylesterase/DNA-binding winged helix-turn-helix (wHTH) protein